MKNNTVFKADISNGLAAQTEWESHEMVVVHTAKVYRFNNTKVSGLIQIFQPDAYDKRAYAESGDIEDLSCLQAIEITASTARELAAKLIRAADAADKLTNE